MVFQSSWTVIEDRIGTENTAARLFQSAIQPKHKKHKLAITIKNPIYILIFKKKFTKKLVYSSFKKKANAGNSYFQKGFSSKIWFYGRISIKNRSIDHIFPMAL